MTPTRADIAAYARTYLGVRWGHQCRSRQRIDCGGLITLTAQHFELSSFDTTNYDQQPDGTSLMNLLKREMKEIRQSQAGIGDVVAMAGNKWACHVAILGDWNGTDLLSIIHASALSPHCVVENRLDLSIHKVVAYFRYPGVPW